MCMCVLVVSVYDYVCGGGGGDGGGGSSIVGVSVGSV